MSARQRHASGYSSQMALARWKLLELATLFVELDIARNAQGVRVEYDVRLPDLLTKRLRQVDVAVSYQIGEQEFLRTIEVQDRSSKKITVRSSLR